MTEEQAAQLIKAINTLAEAVALHSIFTSEYTGINTRTQTLQRLGEIGKITR